VPQIPLAELGDAEAELEALITEATETLSEIWKIAPWKKGL